MNSIKTKTIVILMGLIFTIFVAICVTRPLIRFAKFTQERNTQIESILENK